MTAKTYALLLGLIILSLYSYGQQPDCKKFRNGIFKMADKEMPTLIIQRKGNKQIEIKEGKKDGPEYTVKWLDDCTYTLKPTKKTLKLYYPSLPNSATLTVRIIEVKANSYIQKSTSNFSDLEMTSEVVKID
jgi:hypothetical protein